MLHVLNGFRTQHLLYYVLLGYGMQKGLTFTQISFEEGGQKEWPMPLMAGMRLQEDVWRFHFDGMGEDALYMIERCPRLQLQAWCSLEGTHWLRYLRSSGLSEPLGFRFSVPAHVKLTKEEQNSDLVSSRLHFLESVSTAISL